MISVWVDKQGFNDFVYDREIGSVIGYSVKTSHKTIQLIVSVDEVVGMKWDDFYGCQEITIVRCDS